MAFTSGYKVNEGTDYEFTVSNETISEMVQASDTGITEADIASYCYSALIDSRIETVKAESHTDTQQPDWHSWCQDNAMFYYIDETRYINSNTNINNTSDTVYERNFLVWYGTIYPGEPEQKTGWFLIMDIKDIKNFYVDFSSAGFSQSSVASTSTEDDVTTPFKGYTGDAYLYQSDLENIYPNIYQKDDTITTIRVVNILNINDELWIGRLNPSNYGNQTVGETKYGYVSYTSDNFYNKGWLTTSDTEHFFQTGSTNWSGIPKIYDMEYPDLGFNVAPIIESYAESDDMLIRVNAEHYGGFNVTSVAVIGTKTLNGILTWMSWCGLKFQYQNTMYKPIISGGVIVGYSDNMDAESEYDDMTNVTGNNISPTPPGPTPPGPSGDDPSDDQAWGGAYSGAGAFSKFYLCTATDLANLRTWFGGGGSGDQIPDGFDPMGQVIGLLQYPISISGTALAPDEIIFRSGKTILHTGVSADRSTGGFLHINCGSVEIPRRMQQRGVPFLDFETSLEIYVPFCGTAPLDVQTCVGKTLTCDMYVATATGDVSAVIAAGGHPVAYMSGNMAESLPISSAGYGMYLAACKSTWGNGVSQVMNQLTGGTTNTIKNVNQAALNETLSYEQTGGWSHSELITESYNNPAIGRAMAGAASAKGVAAIGLATTASNVVNAASTGYEQYQRVKNASYTSVSGSFTSCAAWNYPFTPYVKITRPHEQIPTGGTGDYKHTTAIPLVETRNLSGSPGLTTCVNPDVSGIANATAQEKDIIYRALVNGVIV